MKRAKAKDAVRPVPVGDAKELTPEQKSRGRALLEKWERENYCEPTVYGIGNLRGKGIVEKWREKYRKARAIEEQRIFEEVTKTKDSIKPIPV